MNAFVLLASQNQTPQMIALRLLDIVVIIIFVIKMLCVDILLDEDMRASVRLDSLVMGRLVETIEISMDGLMLTWGV
jgi:hypothetical protein